MNDYELLKYSRSFNRIEKVSSPLSHLESDSPDDLAAALADLK